MSCDSVARKGPEQANPETESRLVATRDWWWGLWGITLEPGCAVRVPCTTTQATSTRGEEWRRIHSVACPAGCWRGDPLHDTQPAGLSPGPQLAEVSQPSTFSPHQNKLLEGVSSPALPSGVHSLFPRDGAVALLTCALSQPEALSWGPLTS